MTTGFVKIYASITRSSVWLESNETRLVWITMLVAAGPDGVVEASVGGLAHLARVTKSECRAALDVLEAPDEDSRSEEHDGRRIEKVDGGWLVLNHAKYRERQSDRNAKAAERQRRWRERKALRDVTETDVTPSSHQKSEAEVRSRSQKQKSEAEGVPPPSDSPMRRPTTTPQASGLQTGEPGSERDDEQEQRPSSGDERGRPDGLRDHEGPGLRGGGHQVLLVESEAGGSVEPEPDREAPDEPTDVPKPSGGRRGGVGRSRGRVAEPSADAVSVAQHLYDAIQSHSPEFGTKPVVTAQHLTVWARAIDVGLRNDGFAAADYRRAIDYAHKGTGWVGWKANIRSGKSLRAKCDQLLAQAKSKTTTTSGSTPAGYTSDGVRLDTIDYSGVYGKGT